MAEHHVMDEHSEEWHQHRANMFNASEAPAVMGVNPWVPQTPFQLFRKKMGFEEEANNQEIVNPAIQRGQDLEPYARQEVAELLGEPMEPHVLTNGRLSASLDGVDFDFTKGVEIKSPWKGDESDTAKAVIEHGLPPLHYYAQVQHQIFTAGLNCVLFYVYGNPEDGQQSVSCWVYPDEHYINQLINAWEEFGEYLDAGSPPPLMDQDCDERDDKEWVSLAQQLAEAKAEKDEIDKKYEDLKKSLIEMARHPKTKGGGVTLTKVVSKGSFDYKRAAQDAGVDLEPYRKAASESWRPSFDQNDSN